MLLRCPACGEGRLFAGFLQVVDHCAVCGTDFTRLNTGDGAAVFIMQISGGISAFLALGLQIAFAPPLWVLLIVAVPLVLALSFGLMRPGKGLMIAIQIGDRDRGASPHV
ncbi:DUF983 domain-containing protein [Brevundimonas sp.]|uniref:DUF983 domain-containing protein n=1 Tax=Brevundimonas sp. TaxID=1871086 RepID=UPI003AF8D510